MGRRFNYDGKDTLDKDLKKLVKKKAIRRSKYINTLSLEEIESLMCKIPVFHFDSDIEKEVAKDLMWGRQLILNSQFEWTEENKAHIVRVSDNFLKAWEEGYARAKIMWNALYEKYGNEAIEEAWGIDIRCSPLILQYEEYDDSKEHQIYGVLKHYLGEFEFEKVLSEGAYKRYSECECLHTDKEINWNDHEWFSNGELKDHYICYALHVLWGHNNWAYQDIAKIDCIHITFKVHC